MNRTGGRAGAWANLTQAALIAIGGALLFTSLGACSSVNRTNYRSVTGLSFSARSKRPQVRGPQFLFHTGHIPFGWLAVQRDLGECVTKDCSKLRITNQSATRDLVSEAQRRGADVVTLFVSDKRGTAARTLLTSKCTSDSMYRYCRSNTATHGALRSKALLWRKAPKLVPDQALLFAADLGFVGLAKWALKRGANPNARRRTAPRYSALSLAIVRRRMAIVQLLLDSGASTHTPDDRGQTPLSIMARYFNEMKKHRLPGISTRHAYLDGTPLMLLAIRAKKARAVTSVERSAVGHFIRRCSAPCMQPLLENARGTPFIRRHASALLSRAIYDDKCSVLIPAFSAAGGKVTYRANVKGKTLNVVERAREYLAHLHKGQRKFKRKGMSASVAGMRVLIERVEGCVKQLEGLATKP